MSSPSLVFPAIDAAIAQFESGGNPAAASVQANNPGALQPGAFATQYGATGAMAVAGGQQIATVPTAAAGAAAQDALVQNYASQGDTIAQLIQNWVGPNSPAPTSYQNFVANAVGQPASTPVSQLAGVAPSSSASAAGAPATGGLASTWSALTQLADYLDNFFGTSISWGRVAAFLLGLIVIVGGLFLLRGVSVPSNSVGSQIVRGGRRAGEALSA